LKYQEKILAVFIITEFGAQNSLCGSESKGYTVPVLVHHSLWRYIDGGCRSIMYRKELTYVCS